MWIYVKKHYLIYPRAFHASAPDLSIMQSRYCFRLLIRGHINVSRTSKTDENRWLFPNTAPCLTVVRLMAYAPRCRNKTFTQLETYCSFETGLRVDGLISVSHLRNTKLARKILIGSFAWGILYYCFSDSNQLRILNYCQYLCFHSYDLFSATWILLKIYFPIRILLIQCVKMFIVIMA